MWLACVFIGQDVEVALLLKALKAVTGL